jgi:hypothetical protein
MSEREKLLITVIKLLTEECDCLRSVLSEWDTDKNCFVQMNRAEILMQARETLEYKV